MNPFSLLGSPLMMYNIAKDPMPTNSVGDLKALQEAFKAAHAKNLLKGPPVQGLDLPPDYRPPQVSPQFLKSPGVSASLPTPVPQSPFASAANNIVAQNNQPSVPLGATQTLPTKPMPPVQPMGLGVGGGLPMAPPAAGGGIQPQGVPLPQPRPPMPTPAPAPSPAPQVSTGGPPMGFFQRNAAMMRDPVTGNFIDPAAAQSASQDISGPKLVQKFMNYLHKETT